MNDFLALQMEYGFEKPIGGFCLATCPTNKKWTDSSNRIPSLQTSSFGGKEAFASFPIGGWK